MTNTATKIPTNEREALSHAQGVIKNKRELKFFSRGLEL